MSELTFCAEEHTYRLGGRDIPSITQVLHIAGLIDTSHYTEYARDRGTYVHTALEYLDSNALDEESLDDALRPYVEAWKKFKRDTECEISSCELHVCNDVLGYAGTLDRILRVRDESWLIDIKNGQKEQWHALQTAAYVQCLPVGAVHKRGCVFLKNNGTYKLELHGDYVSDRQVFNAALSIAKWKLAKGVNAYVE